LLKKLDEAEGQVSMLTLTAIPRQRHHESLYRFQFSSLRN
jgi:hypothetical protein